MKLSLFDLHCDTAYEMLHQNRSLDVNDLAVSLENAEKFEHYAQMMAYWTPPHLSDEDGFFALNRMHQNLMHDPAVKQNRTKIITGRFSRQDKRVLLLSVEDARILNGCIERVDRLWQMGIRFNLVVISSFATVNLF